MPLMKHYVLRKMNLFYTIQDTRFIFIRFRFWFISGTKPIVKTYSLSARILHRAPPPRLQVDQNFLTQKIVADPKMRCHQKSFGIWRVTEAILGQKTFFF